MKNTDTFYCMACHEEYGKMQTEKEIYDEFRKRFPKGKDENRFSLCESCAREFFTWVKEEKKLN